MAPGFTPLVLVQVVDLPVGSQTFQTVVPSDSTIIAFHRRADANLMDGVFWSQIEQNGYWALNFSSDLMKQTTTRVYIFSNMVVNTPEYGFYIYANGKIVYHSNCLPLKMLTMDGLGEIGPSTTPLAVCSCITSQYSESYDAIKTYWGYTRSSAGYNTNQYTGKGDGYYVTGNEVYVENMNNIDQHPNFKEGAWQVSSIGYIECDIYDQYYKQALGY